LAGGNGISLFPTAFVYNNVFSAFQVLITNVTSQGNISYETKVYETYGTAASTYREWDFANTYGVTTFPAPLVSQGNGVTVSIDKTDSISGLSVLQINTGNNPIFVRITSANGTVATFGGAGNITGNGTANLLLSGTIDQVNLDLSDINFTGTYAGTGAVSVVATYAGINSATETSEVTVTAIPPYVSNQTANQTFSTEQQVFLQIPSNTFTDPQNEALTYSASLSNGAALPTWLSFNSNAELLYGTTPAVGPQTISIKVTATDSSDLSVSETFDISVAGPSVPALAISSSGGLTNQVGQTISGTIDAADAGLTVSVYDGTSLLGTVLPSANGSWSTTVNLLPVQGNQDITAQATDAAGNLGSSAPVTYTLDTVAPTLMITNSGGLTNQRSHTISGTIDAADLELTVSIFDGSKLLGTVVPSATGSWTTTLRLLPVLGNQDITAQATDAAGNVGVSAAVTYTLDTAAPRVRITSSGGLTNQVSQTVSGIIDVADAGLAVAVYDGATLLGTVVSTDRGKWSAMVTLPAIQSTQAITARATDAAGNVGISAPVTYTLDTIAPTLTITSPGGATSRRRQAIRGTIDTADAGQTVSIYDGTTLLGTVVPSTNGKWSDVVTLLPIQGSQTIIAQAADAAGNVGISNPVNFTLDKALSKFVDAVASVTPADASHGGISELSHDATIWSAVTVHHGNNP
jgi:hypothetical protein